MPSTKPYQSLQGLSSEQQELLRKTARESIEHQLRGESFQVNLHEAKPPLDQLGASFVTLTIAGRLRGCIGTLEASQTLLLDVAENARRAAFRDPRFLPINTEEWKSCEVSISLLSPPQRLPVTSEKDLLEKLRPGVDGLILSFRHHRATYLPSVWEQLPESATFVRELKRKAGLQPDFWSSELQCEIYQSITV